jgi:hypothetical protein
MSSHCRTGIIVPAMPLAAMPLAAMLLAAMVVTIIGGCGGNARPGPEPPPVPPPVDTAIIKGRVVKADRTTEPLPGSLVTMSTGQFAYADTLGEFIVRDVPVGDGTVEFTVDSISNPDYGSQTIAGVGVSKNDNPDNAPSVTVAVLPINLSQPQAITITPDQATIDLNGEIQFAAPVSGSAGLLQVQPTWYLTTNAGNIDRNGKFTALNVGSAMVVATSGNISALANVVVTPSRPPNISTFLVDPSNLSSSGGTVNVTAAINDGDGLRSVEAQVVDPNNWQTNYAMDLVEGTSPKDGTYRLSLTIDPNDIRQNQEDATRPLTYSIRVVAEDNAGNTSASGFKDVVVAGIDEPIPPPPI